MRIIIKKQKAKWKRNSFLGNWNCPLVEPHSNAPRPPPTAHCPCQPPTRSPSAGLLIVSKYLAAIIIADFARKVARKKKVSILIRVLIDRCVFKLRRGKGEKNLGWNLAYFRLQCSKKVAENSSWKFSYIFRIILIFLQFIFLKP